MGYYLHYFKNLTYVGMIFGRYIEALWVQKFESKLLRLNRERGIDISVYMNFSCYFKIKDANK